MSDELKPHMKPDEVELFKRYLDNSKIYLEFGCGGSTRLAAESKAGQIYSIDTHPDWIAKCKNHPSIRERRQKKEIVIHYLDIGPLGNWGRPKTRKMQIVWAGYSIGPWLGIKGVPDLVFVDGRWRIACALQALLRCEDSAFILVHDWTIRPQYAALLEHANVVEQAHSMVVLSPKPDRDKGAIALAAMEAINDVT